VKTLGALEAGFADDHVPLALVLGTLGALSTVRRVLPEKPAGGASPSSTVSVERSDGSGSPPEQFTALLLGVIAMHERLLAMLGPISARDDDFSRVRDDLGDTPRLEGLLR
jgi:hypothetical protein